MIRQAKQSDYKTLINIEQRSNPHPLSEAKLHGSLFSQINQTFVIFDKHILAGFMIVQIAVDTADIVHIVVDKHHQRKGLAYTLLNSTLNVLNSRGVTQVFLEVRESNVFAQRLYEKCGFTVTGIRKNYYTEPSEKALLMSTLII